MILTIPTFSDPFYEMFVDLDGVGYRFEFRFNQRTNTWFFDLDLEDGTNLVKGIMIVPGVSLLAKFADRRLPPGSLMAANNSLEDDFPPGLLELGPAERVQLVYASAEEFTA